MYSIYSYLYTCSMYYLDVVIHNSYQLRFFFVVIKVVSQVNMTLAHPWNRIIEQMNIANL